MAHPKLLVLPKESTPDARIITLAHPRSTRPSKYYFDPAHGLYEFTQIAAPKAAHRSWLLKSQSSRPLKRKRDEGEQEAETGEHKPRKAETSSGPAVGTDPSEKTTANDYVFKDPELLVATPIDLLFILLPSLIDQKLFLPEDDLLDSLSERSKHFAHVCSIKLAREQMVARLETVCDMVDAGGEQMYRLNEEKLLAELMLKAEKMVVSGLPASMEERFVRRALQPPLTIVKREESSLSANGTETPQSEPMSTESAESQASTSTSTNDSTSTTTASAATNITIPENSIVAEEEDTKRLHRLLRLRTTLSYMLSSYIPPSLATSLTARTRASTTTSPIDFTPLDNRIAEIAQLEAEALAARSLGDFSRKRNLHEEDDAAAESRLEKKRRMDEEEKKKRGAETRGIRDLKKVDTKGMKKMSAFFAKRTSPRKKKEV